MKFEKENQESNRIFVDVRNFLFFIINLSTKFENRIETASRLKWIFLSGQHKIKTMKQWSMAIEKLIWYRYANFYTDTTSDFTSDKDEE